MTANLGDRGDGAVERGAGGGERALGGGQVLLADGVVQLVGLRAGLEFRAFWVWGFRSPSASSRQYGQMILRSMFLERPRKV